MFQRRLIRLTLIMAVCSLIVNAIASLLEAVLQGQVFIKQGWFERTSLGGGQEGEQNAWVQTIMAIVFSGMTLYSIADMREEARGLYSESV